MMTHQQLYYKPHYEMTSNAQFGYDAPGLTYNYAIQLVF